MQFEGAVIKEQAVTFAVVIVKSHVLNDHSKASEMIQSFQQQLFGNIPVVLMAQDASGVPTYYGRRDISNFLSRVPLHAIPWKKYTIG